MQRIPPRQRIRKKRAELLDQGVDREGDVTSLVVRLGIGRVVQEVAEQQMTDHAERRYYQLREPELEYRGCRNAHE
jgi:hypothetical protein